MADMVIRTHYDQLELIATEFDREQTRIQQVHQRVARVIGLLETGGWEGEAASVFCAEMHHEIIPAVSRLNMALGEASRTVHQIIHIMREAEVQAAALLGEPQQSVPETNTEAKQPKRVPVRRARRMRVAYRMQTGDEDPEPTEEETYTALLSYLSTHYPLLLYFYAERLGHTPDLDELFTFYLLVLGQNQDAAVYTFIGRYGPEFLWFLVTQAHANFGAAWEASLNDRNPETYARSWEAFQTWFGEEGIRIISEPADIIMAFDDWRLGEGTFFSFLISIGPVSAPLARRVTGIIARFSDDTINAITPLLRRLSTIGAQGPERAAEFFEALYRQGGDNAVIRLSETYDDTFNSRVFDRIDELRRSGTATNVSDIPVPGLDSGLYGRTRNVSADDLAYEYLVTGKPDPSLAVFVNDTEFDWYRATDSGVTLLDAKMVGTGSSAYDFRPDSVFSTTPWGQEAQQGIIAEARRQSTAAESIGATVEWILPVGTSEDMITALRDRLTTEGITNVTITTVP